MFYRRLHSTISIRRCCCINWMVQGWEYKHFNYMPRRMNSHWDWLLTKIEDKYKNNDFNKRQEIEKKIVADIVDGKMLQNRIFYWPHRWKCVGYTIRPPLWKRKDNDLFLNILTHSIVSFMILMLSSWSSINYLWHFIFSTLVVRTFLEHYVNVAEEIKCTEKMCHRMQCEKKKIHTNGNNRIDKSLMNVDNLWTNHTREWWKKKQTHGR